MFAIRVCLNHISSELIHQSSPLLLQDVTVRRDLTVKPFRVAKKTKKSVENKLNDRNKCFFPSDTCGATELLKFLTFENYVG